MLQWLFVFLSPSQIICSFWTYFSCLSINYGWYVIITVINNSLPKPLCRFWPQYPSPLNKTCYKGRGSQPWYKQLCLPRTRVGTDVHSSSATNTSSVLPLSLRESSYHPGHSKQPIRTYANVRITCYQSLSDYGVQRCRIQHNLWKIK
jgi:hypothetical protein